MVKASKAASKMPSYDMQMNIARSLQKLGRKPTAHEMQVYKIALSIPEGKVMTYGEVAKMVGSAPRAVGQALRRNPFAPDVPCHRIVKTSLDLGGFDGHTSEFLREKKKTLLEQEGVKFKGTRLADKHFIISSSEL